MNSSDVISDLLDLDLVGGVRTDEPPRIEAPRSGSIETTELQVFPVHGTSVDELYRRLRALDYEMSAEFDSAVLSADGYVSLRAHDRLA